MVKQAMGADARPPVEYDWAGRTQREVYLHDLIKEGLRRRVVTSEIIRVVKERLGTVLFPQQVIHIHLEMDKELAP